MGDRYAIVGTGAVGGYYGACLQKSGVEVHFLLHSDYDHVRQQGLRVDSPDGDFHLPQVHAHSHPASIPPCDVVIVALKTTQNEQLPSLLPPLTPAGVVIVLQNGLNVEAQAAAAVGAKRVVGGLAFICSNKVGPGHIRHLDYNAIALGEYRPEYAPTGPSERLTAIAHQFEQADIPVTVADDLLRARWEKLLWNIPFNGLSVVLNATTDEMIQHPGTRALAEALMQEVDAIATAQGRPLGQERIRHMLAHTEAMTSYNTSMKLDYDRGHPLELAAIFEAPLQAAIAAGVAVPRIAMLHQQLLFLNPARTDRSHG